MNHLHAALRQQYDITVDPTGSLYCGLTLRWHYDKHYVDVSRLGYVDKLLHYFRHPRPSEPKKNPAQMGPPGVRYYCPIFSRRIRASYPPPGTNKMNTTNCGRGTLLCLINQ